MYCLAGFVFLLTVVSSHLMDNECSRLDKANVHIQWTYIGMVRERRFEYNLAVFDRLVQTNVMD